MSLSKEFLGKFDDPVVSLKPNKDDFELWQAMGLKPADVHTENREAYQKYLDA